MPKAPETSPEAHAFSKTKPMMTDNEAVIEASRCLFCHDAPCIIACPSSIDIPMFIRQIMSQNPEGSAHTIFTQNILGKSCGQVCPTEVLCEGSCVYHGLNEKPIDIGRLQAYATDHAIQHNIRYFEKGAPTGKKVAVIGGGPAGLACAHELTRLGHDVTVYEGNKKAGGLNAYGVAPYKFNNAEAEAEVDYITQIGFTVETGTRIVTDGDKNIQWETVQGKKWQGKTVALADLEKNYDAIFLGLGLGQSRRTGLPGEKLEGIVGAAEFIHHYRDKEHKVAVGKNVIVIGAGNTAIDASVAAKKLGAEQVTLVYRRSEQDQSAYAFEIDYARCHGVRFIYLASPSEFMGEKTLQGVQFIKNKLLPPDASGKSAIEPIAGSEFVLPADMVILATGQEKKLAFYKAIPELTLQKEKVMVNEKFQTTNPKYFAGGDCVNGGKEVVNAVAHGRDAARGIHEFLTGEDPFEKAPLKKVLKKGGH